MKNSATWALMPLLFIATSCGAETGHNKEREITPQNILEERALSISPQEIARKSADLNGDGLSDTILVLEHAISTQHAEGFENGSRELQILLAQQDGSLKKAAVSDKVVYCSSCGGQMGDPFVGIEAATNLFTVKHYGGSAWRWTADYTFGYSHRDQSWQLVRVKETSFHASNPSEVETEIFTPPEDFGLIDIADFDPENWRGQGKK